MCFYRYVASTVERTATASTTNGMRPCSILFSYSIFWSVKKTSHFLHQFYSPVILMFLILVVMTLKRVILSKLNMNSPELPMAFLHCHAGIVTSLDKIYDTVSTPDQPPWLWPLNRFLDYPASRLIGWALRREAMRHLMGQDVPVVSSHIGCHWESNVHASQAMDNLGEKTH